MSIETQQHNTATVADDLSRENIGATRHDSLLDSASLLRHGKLLFLSLASLKMLGCDPGHSAFDSDSKALPLVAVTPQTIAAHVGDSVPFLIEADGDSARVSFQGSTVTFKVPADGDTLINLPATYEGNPESEVRAISFNQNGDSSLPDAATVGIFPRNATITFPNTLVGPGYSAVQADNVNYLQEGMHMEAWVSANYTEAPGQSLGIALTYAGVDYYFRRLNQSCPVLPDQETARGNQWSMAGHYSGFRELYGWRLEHGSQVAARNSEACAQFASDAGPVFVNSVVFVPRDGIE